MRGCSLEAGVVWVGAGRARIKEVEWQLGTVRNRKSPSSSIKSKRLSFPATEILHGPHNSYRRAEPEISSKKLHSVRPHDQDVRVCVFACAWLRVAKWDGTKSLWGDQESPSLTPRLSPDCGDPRQHPAQLPEDPFGVSECFPGLCFH